MTNKKLITNNKSLLNTYIYKALGLFIILVSVIASVKSLMQEQTFLSPLFILFTVLTILFIIFMIKVFKGYSDLSELYYSDAGIHAEDQLVSWDKVTDFCIDTDPKIQILYVEFKEIDDSYLLKTPVGNLNEATTILNLLKSKWSEFSEDNS